MRTFLEITEISHKEGLIFLGAVSLEVKNDYLRYEAWLKKGKHASLSYLESNRECREDPSRLLPNASCALVFGLPYSQGDTWPMAPNEGPRIAMYARFPDYHKLLRSKLDCISSWIRKEWGGECRSIVDSAPVLERALAAKSGAGFIGKNSCFIHPAQGSLLLLGEILSTVSFPTEEKTEKAECGECTLCQVECPTGALNDDYEIDSRRCLSYWTIENRGTIPLEFWPWLSKYYFGCDICQIVCPFNREATNQLDSKIPRRESPDLFQVATMDQKQYEVFFGGTAMTRAKRDGLMRNAFIALVVGKDPRVSEVVRILSTEKNEMLQATLRQYGELKNPSPTKLY